MASDGPPQEGGGFLPPSASGWRRFSNMPRSGWRRPRPPPPTSTIAPICWPNVSRVTPATIGTLRLTWRICRRSTTTTRRAARWPISKSGGPAALKKALDQEQWSDVFVQGLKVLTVNPWDVPTLAGMALAAKKCGLLGVRDVLSPLRPGSQSQRPGNESPLRNCRGRPRVVRPGDCLLAPGRRGPAHRRGGQTVDLGAHLAKGQSPGRFRRRGGRAEAGGQGRPAGGRGNFARTEAVAESPREPENMAHYLELCQVYFNEERYKDAEE